MNRASASLMIVALMVAFGVAGCSEDKSLASPTEPSALGGAPTMVRTPAAAASPVARLAKPGPADLPKPSLIASGSQPMDTKAYVVSRGLALGIEAVTGIKATVEPIGTDVARAEATRAGALEFAQLDTTTVGLAIQGKAPFRWRPQPIRQLFQGHWYYVIFVTAPRTGAKTFEDVKAKRMRFPKLPVAETGANLEYQGIAAAYGMPDQLKWIPFADIQATRYGLIEGTVDVVVGGAGTIGWKEVERSVGLQVLPLPDPSETQKWELYRQHAAHAEPVILEANNPELSFNLGRANGGLDKVQASSNRFVYVAWPTLSEAAAYWIAKGTIEGYDAYKKVHPVLESEYKLSNLLPRKPAVIIPFHNGAIRYYREIGAWTAEHDAFQQQALALEKQRLGQ